MDLKGNYIPLNVRKIHIIAACGTGMGALACMLKDMGFEVTGSDHNIYPPMSDFLLEKEIVLSRGFSPSNLDYMPELVIIGNAVTKDNIEAVAVMEKKLPYCSMPQALNHFIARDKKILLITGTHGKTTTSSILAHVLNQAGLDPSFMIGGIVKGFESNYRIGRGDYIVIEGDEYDTAFFDKGPKFIHYSPDTAIITSVEFDHADIFRDIDHIKETFRQLVAKIPQQSLIMASGEDNNIRDIIDAAVCNVQYYGEIYPCGNTLNITTLINSAPVNNGWSYSNLSVENGHTTFLVQKNIIITTPLMGRHNVMNTLAVFGVAKRIGIDDETIVRALKSFPGVRRRQDIRGVKRGVTVMDDFAHHPSAVRETISGVKPFFKEGRLVAVFEPRTNSSMRDIFQNDYAQAFDGADIVCIKKPSMLSKIPENQRINSEQLVKDILKRGVRALYFDDTERIIDFIATESRDRDLILIMSNGGFDNIHKRLLENL